MIEAGSLGKIAIEAPRKSESDFRVEYGRNIPDQALLNDIVSYLGEYRFNIPKFSYELKYSGGKLRDPHTGDSMGDVAQRAIDLGMQKGKPTLREQAEKSAFQKLDKRLESANEGNTIIWISPPGPKEEKYGGYGFIFFGKVGKERNGEKDIKMTAIRIEHPTIDQFNKVFPLLTFRKENYTVANGFLANPEVLEENISGEYVDSVLGQIFSFTPNEKEQAKFQRIILEMFPAISDLAQSLKNPWKAKAEKIKELYSLENYALKLKREYEDIAMGERVIVDFRPMVRMADIVGDYGFKPPQVAGSCPTKDDDETSLTSSNIFSKGSFLNNLFGEQKWFKCPKCKYQADGPIGDTCPGCKLTKAEYAQETGVSCD